MKFVRYTNPAALADHLGPCPRCGTAMVTGSVWDNDIEPGKFRLACDSEKCIAEAAQLINEGHGI